MELQQSTRIYNTEKQQQLRVAKCGVSFTHVFAKRRKTSNFGCKVDGILVQAVLSDSFAGKGWTVIQFFDGFAVRFYFDV